MANVKQITQENIKDRFIYKQKKKNKYMTK